MNKTLIIGLFVLIALSTAILMSVDKAKATDMPLGTEVRAIAEAQRVYANDDGTVSISIFAVYVAKAGGMNDAAPFEVNLVGNETPIQINKKITAAVRDYALSIGYVMDGNDLILPPFERGVN